MIEAVSRFSNSRKGPEIRLVSLKKRHDASGHQKIVFRAVFARSRSRPGSSTP